MRLHPIKQLEHRHPQRVGDHLDGVQRRVGLASLKPTEVGLGKAASFAEDGLTHPGLQPKRTNTGAESLSQGLLFHPAIVWLMI